MSIETEVSRIKVLIDAAQLSKALWLLRDAMARSPSGSIPVEVSLRDWQSLLKAKRWIWRATKRPTAPGKRRRVKRLRGKHREYLTV